MGASEKLFILWTSSEPETFDEMVFMYAFNGKKYKWWQEITVIVWGASAKLAGEDEVIQVKVKELIEGGVHVSACKACADDLGVSAKLEELGVEVKYWGQELTSVIKSDAHLITV
jgi:hypothetical protein